MLSLSHWGPELCAGRGCSAIIWMWQWFCYGISRSWHIIVITFLLGQPCFERNAFAESENCNHCMFITSVSCFYWSTHEQYIITWTYWSNQMCSGRKNNINVQFEGCYFEIMALRIWERELNVLHSNANLRFMSQSILSSLFHPIPNANYWHKNLQPRIVVRSNEYYSFIKEITAPDWIQLWRRVLASKFLLLYVFILGHTVAQLVETLRYKPERRWFDSRCSSRTMALRSTQLPTEVITRNTE